MPPVYVDASESADDIDTGASLERAPVHPAGSVPHWWTPRAHLITFSLLAVVVVIATVLMQIDPDGVGPTIYGGLALVLILAFCVGPLLLRPRPLKLWIPLPLAGVSFVISLTTGWAESGVGPMEYIDIFYFGGFALMLLWIGLIPLHVGRNGSGILTILDAVTVTFGALLTLSLLLLVPLMDQPRLGLDVSLAVYPSIDLALIALSLHLAYLLGRRVVAMRIILVSLVWLLAVDLAYVAATVFAPEWVPVVMGGYIWAYFGFTAAGLHPSCPELTKPAEVRPDEGVGRPLTLTAFTIVPVLAAVATPAASPWDIPLRTTLLLILMVLLFARLALTMSALSTAEADSRHRATHDASTGLLNRAALFERLEDRLAEHRRGGPGTAVIFLDCNDFKYVNDTWGHHAGDRLLKEIARRLPPRLREGDILARHGGDEFVAVATVHNDEEALTIARRLRAAFNTPLQVHPRRMHSVSAALGVAVSYPGDGISTEDLLGRADLAMFEAKRHARKGLLLFDDSLAEASRLRSRIGDRLAGALQADAFDVYLQPILGGPGYGDVVGWEALARWTDEENGFVSPLVFIPLAEQLGLIGDLGERILRKSCRALAAHLADHPGSAQVVSVNISPAQLEEPGLTDIVCRALADTNLAPDHLWLEVTETMLLDTGPEVMATLAELRDMGIRVLLDDFGTGFATVGTLLALPIDCLKIDRCFVSPLGTDPAATTTLKGLLDLVGTLGISSAVAEGVETAEQAAILESLGCPLVQGFHFARPAPIAEVLGQRDAPHPSG
ncbi:MAG: EAL domain-containing protein [Mobilicoccus sp.]|nr:EAL domain-containing protein [Mobilicoccus sp.]